MRSLTFEVPGEPRGKGRPRFARRGKRVSVHTPEATASYENWIRVCAMQAAQGSDPWPAGVPLVLDIEAVFPIPVSWSKRKQADAHKGALRPTSPRVDADNVLKVVGDALNGVLWADDGQVVTVCVVKRYTRDGEAPAVHVSVTDDA